MRLTWHGLLSGLAGVVVFLRGARVSPARPRLILVMATTRVLRYALHPHEQLDGATPALGGIGRGMMSMASASVEEDLSDLDRLVDVNMTLQSIALDNELWQDMNKPDGPLKWGGLALQRKANAPSSAVSSTSAPTSSSKETPQRVGSCDEYEVALLRADGFTVEDHAASLSTDEDVRAQLNTCDAAPLDASFFAKFAINITPESVFGIDGTGAGVGVGASYYESSYVPNEGGDGAEDESVELNSRGAPRRKRKLSQSQSRSEWADLDAFVPLYSGSAGRRQLAVVGGSSTGSSRRSDDDSEASDDMEPPFAFVHDSRGDNKGKRQSRGKYKCSRCGEQKNNHTCTKMTDLDFAVSSGTQSDPTGFSLSLIETLSSGADVVISCDATTSVGATSIKSAPKGATKGLPTEQERVLVARPWKG